MLGKVLQHRPPEWEDESYAGRRFVLKEVEKKSEEFAKVEAIVEEFSRRKVESVMRIQHPYAYGRFLLKKSHTRLKYHHVHEIHQMKFIADKGLLDEILEYNCDKRKSTIWSYDFSLPCAIIIRKLSQSQQISDSDYYPEYFVELGKDDESISLCIPFFESLRI